MASFHEQLYISLKTLIPIKSTRLYLNTSEITSDQRFVFPQPDFADESINISWFVSRGYIVCTPDIHCKKGAPGKSAYNSVVAVAQYLSKEHWVDASRMGIVGQSFGAYETNYLVTHTKLFAAAISTCGVSNLPAFYGGLLGSMAGFRNGQTFSEIAQFRMGGNLWQNLDSYLESSPIFKIDQVSTPILMMCNKGDKVVPWMQGIEFFSGFAG